MLVVILQTNFPTITIKSVPKILLLSNFKRKHFWDSCGEAIDLDGIAGILKVIISYPLINHLLEHPIY